MSKQMKQRTINRLKNANFNLKKKNKNYRLNNWDLQKRLTNYILNYEPKIISYKNYAYGIITGISLSLIWYFLVIC